MSSSIHRLGSGSSYLEGVSGELTAQSDIESQYEGTGRQSGSAEEIDIPQDSEREGSGVPTSEREPKPGQIKDPQKVWGDDFWGDDFLGDRLQQQLQHGARWANCVQYQSQLSSLKHVIKTTSPNPLYT